MGVGEAEVTISLGAWALGISSTMVLTAACPTPSGSSFAALGVIFVLVVGVPGLVPATSIGRSPRRISPASAATVTGESS